MAGSTARGSRHGRRVVSVMHGPVYGGAHNQLVLLDPFLREAGFESVAVVPPEAEAAARRIEAAGIEVVRLPLSSFRLVRDPRENLRAAAEARSNIRALRRVIRDQRADLVQTHGAINLHAGVAAELEDVAVVWQLLDSRAPMPVRRMTMPLITRIADAITSWGRGLAESHPGAMKLGERLVVVYPPVDPELVPDRAARELARSSLEAPPGAPIVGTIGARNATKGHEYLVRAAAIVKREHPSAAFRIVGSPSPTHGELNAAIEAEARALGLLGAAGIEFVDPGAPATTLLQGFDVFAMTSVPLSEGMPTAILEAMACAKPVVSTNVGAIDELIDDGVSGLLVESRDERAIAGALSRLLSDPALGERIGLAGRERALRAFSLERLGPLHARAYRIALSHRHG